MSAFSATTVIRRGQDHVETRVGDQTMMMSVAHGKYYALEAVAQRIWDLLEEPATVDALVDALVAEYDVPRAQCAADVATFLTDLEGNGLIEAERPDGDPS